MLLSQPAELLRRFEPIVSPRRLMALLDGWRYVFHGIDARDLDGVLEEGFRWLPGKASFSLDPHYTVAKYATLGRNSRHRYGPRYAADLQSVASRCGAVSPELSESLALDHWSRSEDETALRVVDRGRHLLRPGIGDALAASPTAVLGGLSKWLHFHLGLWDVDAQQWPAAEAAAWNRFVAEQDRRYRTAFR